jgi:predicted dehydrogenase
MPGGEKLLKSLASLVMRDFCGTVAIRFDSGKANAHLLGFSIGYLNAPLSAEERIVSDREVRIGIIGTGKIGNSHLRKYADIPGARVVAVADIDRSVAVAAAKQHGVRDVYTDYHEMLEREDIEAVDVCLHNMLHRPVSCDAMRMGKHVYCEKPIAATYADGLAMVECSCSTGQMLHIQVGTMFGAASRAAKELVESGRCGGIYHARTFVNLKRKRPFVDGKNSPQFVQRETAGGGALIDWGIYAICRVLYPMGNPHVERITGQTYDRLPMNQKLREDSGYNVEEMGAGFVHFENGATLDVLAAWALNLDQDAGCCLAGEKGGIIFAPFFARDVAPVRFFSAVEDPWIKEPLDLEAAKARWQEAGDGDAYDSPQQHWVRVLQGKVPLMPTAEVALNMILIAEGIYRSADLGREVRADEITAPEQVG